MTAVADGQGVTNPRSELNGPEIRLALSPMAGLRIGLGIFGAFFLVAFARNVPDTLTRFVLGLIFALALDPVVVRIRNRLGCTRGAAVGLVGLLAILVFSLVIAVVGPQAVSQARTFSSELPQTVDKLTTLPVVGEVFQRADLPTRIRNWAANIPERLSDEAIVGLVQGLVGGVVAGLTVLAIGIALLADGEVLVGRLQAVIPRAHRERSITVGRVFYRTVGAYFAGSILVSSLAATFVLTVGLALGVPLAPAVALWVLVVNLIPQIGGFLGASMFTLLGFANSPGTGVLCLLLYVVYMSIENHVLQPLIIGSAVDMSAAATMLAALIGGAAGGVPGAILATPLVGTGKALYLELRHPDLRDRRGKRPTLFRRIVGAITKIRH